VRARSAYSDITIRRADPIAGTRTNR
jgi:hypothetical protein